jgi:Bacterial type II and III secretion system protein
LGDLPLIGRIFRNDSVQGQRNELIIVVTPHIVKPGTPLLPGPALRTLPTPAPLPTLPPNTRLPAPSGQLPHARSAAAARGAASPPTAAPVAVATPIGLVAASPAPLPQPAAFAQTNVFTFGSAPQSNFARPGDPVQIFYATLSPTVVSNGTPVRVAAVTSSNANTVKLQVGTQTISLVQTGAGQWQAAFPFQLSAVPVGQSTLQLALVASRSDGTSATVPIPINIALPP